MTAVVARGRTSVRLRATPGLVGPQGPGGTITNVNGKTGSAISLVGQDIPVTQAITGAVPRTVHAEVFDPGLKPQQLVGGVGQGNPSADTAGLQAAAAAIQAKGGRYVLQLPPVDYTINAAISYTGDEFHVVGKGAQILKANATADLFVVNGNSTSFQGFRVRETVPHTAGRLFAWPTGGQGVWMENLETLGGFDVIENLSGVHMWIVGCGFFNYKRGGLRYGPGYGGMGFLTSTRFAVPADNSNTGWAVKVENGDTFGWANVDCTSQYQPLVVKPPSGSFVRNILATNVLGDGYGRSNSAPAWTFDATQGEIARGLLTNCWGSATADTGFDLVGGVEDYEFSNCRALSNSKHGMTLRNSPAPNNIRIMGGSFMSNSTVANNTYSGIYVEDFVCDLTISLTKVGPCTQYLTGNMQKCGIEIVGNNHERIRIIRPDTTGSAIPVGYGRWTGQFNVYEPNVMPVYANDTAAAAGNYPRGGFYVDSSSFVRRLNI